MVSLMAIIRCKPGSVETVLGALLAVGDYVKAHEAGTLDYVVIRSTDDPSILITQERFADAAAMTAHNDGDGSKAFFSATIGLLGEVTVHVGDVVNAVSAKR
ncbi:putative quinol monooxygenase [Lichenihabitans psoromatis]|uniref:putative quinol monooxygenase n=1 Tax=Lichenihabitans psoromatis TaxID=2528642 RepID=UPI0010383AC6|nr:antibiotic biosynthesis monooxygenase [Lichenihabitans psoromatis]